MLMKHSLAFLCAASVAFGAPLVAREGPTGEGLSQAVNDGVVPKVAGSEGSGAIVQSELGTGLNELLTQVVDAVSGQLKKRDAEGNGIVQGEAGSGLRSTLNDGVVKYVAGDEGILKGDLGEGLDTLLNNVVNNVAGGSYKVKREGPTGEGLEQAVNEGVVPKVAGSEGSGAIIQSELGTGLNELLTQLVSAIGGQLKKRDAEGNGIVQGEAGSGLRSTLNDGVVKYVAGDEGILKGDLGNGLDTLLNNVVNNVAGGSYKVKREGPTGQGLEQAVNDGVVPKVAGGEGSGAIVQSELGTGLNELLTQIVSALGGQLKKRDANGNGIVQGEAGSGLRSTLNDGVVKYVAGDEGILKGDLGNGLDTLLNNVVNNVAGGSY
ncbi:hypothetical protein JCM10207_003394 [Rhodosporidiobolus poonsookiae]